MARDWGAVGPRLRPLAWGCVAVLAILSLLPADEMVRTGVSGYVEHAMAYAGTALLLRLGHPEHKPWPTAAALVIYAGLLEYLQHYSPGRTPAVEGWLASSIGVPIGICGAHLVARLLGRLSPPDPGR